MEAYHITHRENYDAICRDGYLRPKSEKRESGEQSSGFKPDWIARDNQFVFFSPSGFYYNLQPGGIADTYGFVFETTYLVFELDGLVGPDLLNRYDDLMHECAREIAGRMPAHVQADETSRYRDILYGMLNQDETVAGVKDALTLLNVQVGEIQAKHRESGKTAWHLLLTEDITGLTVPLEIVVAQPVPIAEAMRHIKGE